VTASPKVVFDGLRMGESPRWHDGRLWVCDWVAGEVLMLQSADGAETVLTMDTFPFSIDWTPDGRMLVIGGDGRLLEMAADGSTSELASLSSITSHPWNEIEVDGRGNAFVNCIGYDMMSGEDPGRGFVAVVGADATVRREAEDLQFPNGMVVTPDNSTLIVAESHGGCLTAFDIGVDAGLSNRRTWADLGNAAPDGICLDVEGAVWFADVPNRSCTRVAAGGDVLQVVEVDRGCFSCALGGPDGSTLFIVAAEWAGTEAVGSAEPSGQVLSVEVEVPSP